MSNENINDKSVVSNFTWRFLERICAQAVSFVVAIVLARILGPEAYGTVSLLTIFIAIMDIFVDAGFGTALIQKKDSDQVDFSSVFFFNIFSSIVLYIAIYIFSPVIANFYDDASLVIMLRVLAISIILAGLKGVMIAYVSKNFLFKKFFFATIIGTVISAIVGILGAFNGFGPWALIAQHLTNLFFDTLVLWIIVKWKPSFLFSFKRLKSLFSFGWKLLLSSLIDTTYNELRALVIGKRYSTSDLAYYNKAYSFPKVIMTTINTSLDSILLPTMSLVQDSNIKVREVSRKSLKVSTYILMPMLIGLCACASPFIEAILGESWINSVIYLQIFCLAFLFWPVHTSNLNAFKSMGYSNIFLYLEIAKKIIGIALIAVCIIFDMGPIYIAGTFLLCSILETIIDLLPSKKILNYSFFTQMKDIFPQLLLSIIMGLIVYSFNYLPLNCWIKLLVQIPTGIVIYVLGSFLFKIYGFCFLKKMISSRIQLRRTIDE